MRRPTRLGLAVAAVLLVLLGAYTAYWLIVAKRVSDGVAAWAQAERADKIEVSWHSIGVAGYPFAYRVALEDAVRDTRLTPSPELRIPALSPGIAQRQPEMADDCTPLKAGCDLDSRREGSGSGGMIR